MLPGEGHVRFDLSRSGKNESLLSNVASSPSTSLLQTGKQYRRYSETQEDKALFGGRRLVNIKIIEPIGQSSVAREAQWL